MRFYRTLVIVNTPSLLENQVIAKMSSRIPALVFNSGFNAGYPVAESCFNSGSSNPEVSVFECSTPHNSSRCYTMHRNGQEGLEMSSRTVNSVTRSKLVT